MATKFGLAYYCNTVRDAVACQKHLFQLGYYWSWVGKDVNPHSVNNVYSNVMYVIELSTNKIYYAHPIDYEEAHKKYRAELFSSNVMETE